MSVTLMGVQNNKGAITWLYKHSLPMQLLKVCPDFGFTIIIIYSIKIISKKAIYLMDPIGHIILENEGINVMRVLMSGGY